MVGGRSWLSALARRLTDVLPVIVLATFLVFGLQQLVRGDLAVTLAGENATPQRVEEIRNFYGLDKPMIEQYARWLGKAAHGDFSRSLLSGVPVMDSILQKLPNTLMIVAGALLISMAAGIPLGVAAARHTGSAADMLVSLLAALGVALPSFWLGMILVSIFAIDLRWLPATGSVPLSDAPIDSLRHAVLPALALAAAGTAEVARQLRSALGEVLSSQFVRTLRAKGLSPTMILWKHGIKNISVNLLTVLGLLFNRMLAATVVIEAVFAIPGMGTLVVQAAIAKDFPVVQGVVLVMVLLVITSNLIVDVLCAQLDPRVSRR
jgi:peptide/nickel transport system permease protein